MGIGTIANGGGGNDLGLYDTEFHQTVHYSSCLCTDWEKVNTSIQEWVMHIKPGVDFSGLSTEIVSALMIAKSVYARHGFLMTMTSGREGKHKKDSKHYQGFAADIRTRDLPTKLRKIIAAEIKAELGKKYFVRLKISPPHIHIHWIEP